MRQETFTLSQKELQRVGVISACIKGDLTCARAAELLDLTPRHITRLKARYRQGSAAALAHANRGRPSHRRLPDAVREQILGLARGTYAGFNDHHLCEKLVEREGFSLSRETLRRLLRKQGLGPPKKRRAPTHRQRRVRSTRLGELVQLDGSPHDWLEGRGPRLTAVGMQDDATGKILAAQFFSSETAFGYLCLLRQLLRRHGLPLAFYGDRSGVFVRHDDNWTAAPWNNSALPSLPLAVRKPKAASSVSGASYKIVSQANCGSPKPTTSTPPTPSCVSSSLITTAASPGSLAKRKPPGARLRKVWTASAVSCTNGSSAMTMSCSGKAAASRSLSRPVVSASPAPKCRSTKLSTGVSRSTTAILAWSMQLSQGGDIFMLLLG